jgi:hypothetical protein
MSSPPTARATPFGEPPISPEVYGQDAWDGGLFNAGYQRVSAWRPSLARFKCAVEAWLATTGMAGDDTRCHG